MHSGTAHVAFGSSDSLGPCDFKDFVAQSHTPNDHCVRFAVVVTFPDATLVTKRALPLTWAGLSPAGSRQLHLAHYWTFTAQRFAVGLFIGGILPTANALVGRLAPRTDRGTVSAMFLGNSLGPLTGGAVAAAFGLRWVFLVTALVLLANLVWVYYRVPEYVDRQD